MWSGLQESQAGFGGMRYRQARQASLRTLTLEPLLRGVVQDGMQEGMEENEDRRN